MNPIPQSPRIDRIAWGQVDVGGRTYKDVKLWPEGAREWNWGETGTRHVPGIQPSDVQELLAHGASRIILSRGMHERLQVCPETLEFLKAVKLPVEVLQTEKAVEAYNANLDSVGALIHSTC